MEIVNTLLNINGSMKEFAEEIESKMGRAYKSKVGKKYGISEAEMEMRRVMSGKGSQSSLGFGKVKDSIKDIEKRAREYVPNGVNLKFLKK